MVTRQSNLRANPVRLEFTQTDARLRKRCRIHDITARTPPPHFCTLHCTFVIERSRLLVQMPSVVDFCSDARAMNGSPQSLSRPIFPCEPQRRSASSLAAHAPALAVCRLQVRRLCVHCVKSVTNVVRRRPTGVGFPRAPITFALQDCCSSSPWLAPQTGR
jgi:hypothetical protein